MYDQMVVMYFIALLRGKQMSVFDNQTDLPQRQCIQLGTACLLILLTASLTRYFPVPILPRPDTSPHPNPHPNPKPKPNTNIYP